MGWIQKLDIEEEQLTVTVDEAADSDVIEDEDRPIHVVDDLRSEK